MKNRSIQFALLLLLAIHIQGCSRETSSGNIEIGKPEQSTVSTAENAYKNRSQEFPADYPLPKYPNSQVEVAQLRMTKRSSPSVILQSPDSVDAVFRYYARHLKESGWDIGKVIKNKTYVMLHATKNGREASLMITETRKGPTAISLFVGRK